jgi:26S proteasome regulatory subunit N9
MGDTQILENAKAKHPDLVPILDKLIQYTNSKLYHQLTQTTIEYIQSPCFASGTELVDFFEQFLKPFEKKLDPVSWVFILSIVARQKTPEDALALIAPFEVEKANHRDVYFLWKCLKGEKLVVSKKFEEAKEMLEGLGKEIDEAYDVDHLVHSQFHKTYATLHKELTKPEKFYKSSLQYLAYTSIDKISEKPRVAFEVCVAALIAEGEFDFGELVQQEVMKSLEGDAKYGWIMDLIKAFVEGKFDMYDGALAKNKAQIDGVPELKGAVGGVMTKKMQQLALMDFAFRRPKKQRRLTFKEIADHCRLDVLEVEALVMKTMAEHLIKGKLDQVDEDVTVSWVKPRILDKDRIAMMRERMDAWASQTSMLLDHLEEMTPELLVS